MSQAELPHNDAPTDGGGGAQSTICPSNQAPFPFLVSTKCTKWAEYSAGTIEPRLCKNQFSSNHALPKIHPTHTAQGTIPHSPYFIYPPTQPRSLPLSKMKLATLLLFLTPLTLATSDFIKLSRNTTPLTISLSARCRNAAKIAIHAINSVRSTIGHLKVKRAL